MTTYSLLTHKEGLIAIDAHSPYSAWLMALNFNLDPYDIFEGVLNPELN